MNNFQLLLDESVKKHGHLCAGQVIGVRISLQQNDMPGPPRHHAVCDRCGQMIRDGKELRSAGEIICRPCSDESYFTLIEPCWSLEPGTTFVEEAL